MKNLSLYALAGLIFLSISSCSEDFDNWASPQSFPQEDAVTIPGFTASATSAIDLNSVKADSSQVLSLSTTTLPDGYSLDKVRIELTPADNATEATTVSTSIDGKAVNTDLQTLVENAYGKSPTARTFSGHVYADAIKNGEAILIDAGTINVVVTPAAPHISANYYIIGGTKDWNATAASKEYKFAHSDADVYDDPVFTIVLPIKATGDTWFGIGDDEALDAIVNSNDWSKVLGTTSGDGNSGESGTLAPRSELTDAGSFKVENTTGALNAKVTLNMMDYTYTVELLAPQFYIFGDITGWDAENATKICMTPEGDNVYSYTGYVNGNIKVWSKDDLGNWDKCYNTSKANDNSTAMTGTIEVSNGGAIHSPEAGLWKFTMNLSDMTYSWEKVEPATEYTYISLSGDFNTWGDEDLTQVNAHNWYIRLELTDGNLKLKADHAWTTNWGYGSEAGDWSVSDTEWSNDCVNKGGDIYVPAGTYDIYLNDITNNVRIIPVSE